MLPYFPTPYPDETIYSLIERYHRHIGNSFVAQTLLDLFGQSNLYISMDLPTNLNLLIQTISDSNITLDNLIYNHTLYNFYTAFMSKEMSNRIYQMMMLGTYVDVHNFIGIKSSSVKCNKFLRFCPLCLNDHFLVYGENTMGIKYLRIRTYQPK